MTFSVGNSEGLATTPPFGKCVWKKRSGELGLKRIRKIVIIYFRVFIMIKISQIHVFVKEYVHNHQMRSHFVGGHRFGFSPTE